MRHRLAVAVICVAVPAACATPDHSNVLIFATNTKVALDVSVSPTNAAPDVTLGYKRQEGVWMPLVPNKGKRDQREPIDCQSGIENCGFVAHRKDARDAYSVVASLGANFSAGAGAASQQPGEPGDEAARPSTSTSASGGLAQFFATGIAAQLLAFRGGADLVAVQPIDRRVLQAKEHAEENLSRALSAEERLSAERSEAGKLTDQRAKATLIVNHVGKADGSIDAALLAELLDDADIKTGLDAPTSRVRDRLARQTKVRALHDVLIDELPSWIDRIFVQLAKTKFSGG